MKQPKRGFAFISWPANMMLPSELGPPYLRVDVSSRSVDFVLSDISDRVSAKCFTLDEDVVLLGSGILMISEIECLLILALSSLK